MGVIWAEFGSTSKVQFATSKNYLNFRQGGGGGHCAERPGENTGPPRDCLGPRIKGQSYFGIGLSILFLYVPALLINIIMPVEVQVNA